MRPNIKSVRLFTEKNFENIRSMLANLYNDELLADVTLCCRNGSVRAHKLILAACSPYFRKVFIENGRDHTVFIMHGTDFSQLKNLIDLIYKGSIDVPSENCHPICDLAEDLEVAGVFVDESTIAVNEANGSWNPCSRDTRYRGLKRVAVDFNELDENDGVSSKINRMGVATPSGSVSTSRSTDTDESADTLPSPRDIKHTHIKHNGTLTTETGTNTIPVSSNTPKISTVWAKKLRKFKCSLCPSSFKRASHLTRHQLVHTGERPYACDLCDKAFSRHDKLKHHIKKTHEYGDGETEGDSPESYYTIGHVRILTPEPVHNETPVELSALKPEPTSIQPPVVTPAIPAGSSNNIRLSQSNSGPKKGRGRPRKYPPVPKPLVKRPRGRPRLNPLPTQMSDQLSVKRENYDITNLPFGDIEYLTKPLQEDNIGEVDESSDIMEPLIEIKYESLEKSPDQIVNVEEPNIEVDQIPPPLPLDPPILIVPTPPSSFLGDIGLFENNKVAKIGECTISVANNIV